MFIYKVSSSVSLRRSRRQDTVRTPGVAASALESGQKRGGANGGGATLSHLWRADSATAAFTTASLWRDAAQACVSETCQAFTMGLTTAIRRAMMG